MLQQPTEQFTTTATATATSQPLQPGYLPGTAQADATDMLITFADGERVLPGWIVAHHGGNAQIEKISGELSGIEYAAFVRAFFDEAGANHLKGLQAKFVKSAISDRLKHQQRFRPGR